MSILGTIAGTAGTSNPWVGAGLGIASLIGGLFGNKNKQQQQQQTQSQTNSLQDTLNRYFQENSQSNFSRPVYDPMQGTLRDNLLMQHMNRIYDGGEDVAASHYFTNLRSINEGTNRLKNNISEQYANRGLQYSPAAAVGQIGAESNRLGNIVNLEGSIPSFLDNLKNQRMQAAGQYLQSLPYATASDSVGQQNGQSVSNMTGSSTTNGTVTGTMDQSQGGGIGGGLQSLITTLAGLYGNGAFSGGGTNKPAATQTPAMGFGQINPNFVINSPFRFSSGLGR